MTPQMHNVLAHIANAHSKAIFLIGQGETKKAMQALFESHPFTAHGESLDQLAIQVGLPHRRGVALPDEDLRAAIIKEIGMNYES